MNQIGGECWEVCIIKWKFRTVSRLIGNGREKHGGTKYKHKTYESFVSLSVSLLDIEINIY